ncbi:sensor histidine kinase YesM [Aquimarina sp. EL_43]|uniref:sensor histidine kinase n=1 Tax=unclassified Aquimarina TaxID=2627091 RepID=UPI0018C9CCCC|nr:MULTISPECIES: histidine kinase [unclassified Aquimarina]MBG6130571.1 sensor histidine kinase YesM [Aquimarina sp. EL_35]MBG6151283.1 sensor histidine kinase YesM [Aquimarina sp. EL_32]MBG6168973.1 sensor histidine kinase YesM [Aquimarina sp. EL_43]
MLDKKLFRFIVLFYILACLFGLVNALFQKISGVSFKSFTWIGLIMNYLFNYGTKFIFIILSIIFTRVYIMRKFSLPISIIIHTLISVLLSLYSSVLLLGYEKYVLGYTDVIDIKLILLRLAYSSNFNFFVYFTLITILYAYYYFKKQKDQEIKESNLKTQLLDSKIKILQSQLQPHFLFNALNDISSLMDIDIEKSQDALADLSEMLRKTLSIKDVKYITLEEELSILNKYLGIEKLRFGEKLNFKIDIADFMLFEKVPPLILQPIVENSIKHGFSYTHDTIIIAIKIFMLYDDIVFEITNNGAQLQQEKIVFGNGISNVLERIDTLYQGNYSFDIRNNKNSGVINSIKIPRIFEQGKHS